MKKLFAIVLTICMLVSVLCVPAFAAESADEPAPGTVLRVSALKKNGDEVVIEDYDNFTNGWNYAMGLAADSEKMEENSYERVVVDFCADWNAESGEFNDAFRGEVGFYYYAISVPAGAKVTLDLNGHTINRGLKRETSYGEVMYIDNKADVIINDGTITGGFGDLGDAGGMDIRNDARVTLNNVHVIGNSSRWDGGGIFVGSGSILTVNGGSFKNNAGTSGYWYNSSYGGAVHVEGTAIFDGVEFKENVAPYGAAISADKGNVVISNCTFDSNGIQTANNVASDTVIYADTSKITITNSIFTNNGGEDLFYFEDSEVLVEGGKVTNNKSEEIFCFEDSKADIKAVTITDNASKTLYVDNGNKVVTMVECILGNNTPTTDDCDVEVDDEDTFIMRDCTLGDTTFEDEDYVKVEYTGVPEKEALISVTKLNKDGTKETTYYRFFKYGWELAMEAAKSNRYDRIVVELYADWNVERGLLGGAIEIPEHTRVTLNMNGHTINANLFGDGLNGEVMYIGVGANVIINDGTITGGYSNNGAGGIHIKENANVVLNNVNVTKNTSEGSDGAGIAVYDGAVLTMNGGSISQNEIHGFFYPYGILYVNDATATLNGVTISDNRGNCDAEGVAIYADNSTVTLNDCVVSGNDTDMYSESIIGAVDSKLIINNTDFINNGAVSDTMDVDYSHLFYLEDSELTMEGGKITGNKADKLFYFDDSKADMKGVTITDNASVVLDIENDSKKVTLTECVLGNNSPVKYDEDIIVDTKGTLVMIDCDLSDTTFENKSMVTFSDKAVGSIFGEGSLAMIVAITALIASAAAIFVSVSSKKKAVPSTANNAEETEGEE